MQPRAPSWNPKCCDKVSALGPKCTPKQTRTWKAADTTDTQQLYLYDFLEYAQRRHSTHAQIHSAACRSVGTKHWRYADVCTEPSRTPSDDQMYVCIYVCMSRRRQWTLTDAGSITLALAHERSTRCVSRALLENSTS